MTKILMVHRVISNIKAPAGACVSNESGFSQKAAATRLQGTNPTYSNNNNYSEMLWEINESPASHAFSWWDLNQQPHIMLTFLILNY